MGNPRYFEHGQAYFVTFRTEENLPFVCIPLINEILWSCIAKAQKLYPQDIAGLSFEPNHGHFMLICIDPETMPAFIGYVKQESAHAINGLLGITKHTVWAEGYDAPAMLDSKYFLKKLAYTLLNPFKDRLVARIEDYKGVNTWKLFQDNSSERQARLLARSSFLPLENPVQPWRENDKVLKQLFAENKMQGRVKLDFYGWKKCFPETEDLSDSEIRLLIINELSVFTEDTKLEHAKLPQKKFYSDLSKQSMLKTYRPKKFGRKSLCLSFHKDLKKSFLSNYFRLKEIAKEVYRRWKGGDLTVRFPAGMFAPSLPRLENICPNKQFQFC